MQAPASTAESIMAPVATAALHATLPALGSGQSSLRWRWLGLALLSGVALYLCHFPVAWGWLAWVALVPVLTLARIQTRGWWLFLCAWSCGLVYYLPAVSWMSVAHPAMIACWIILSLYCALYFPLALWLVRKLEGSTGLPLILTFPVVWTALEFVRVYFMTGFSWYLLAHTQHNMLPVIQIADLGGAFAVSFLVAVVNVVAFEGLIRWAAVRRALGLGPSAKVSCGGAFLVQLGSAVLLLAATLAYGFWCLGYDQFERGPRLALLQANLDQRLRIQAERSSSERARVQWIYFDLCRKAKSLEPRPDLIVWPETSYPIRWAATDGTFELQPESLKHLAEYQDGVRVAGRDAKTNVLLGLNTDVGHADGKVTHYNSALLIDAQGADLRRYDKLHRVPFGEYVPFRDWLPFMNVFSPYDFDYSIAVGDGLTRFPFGKYTFGVLVCYEDTDPALARDYGVATQDGPPADFLLNISNDGWFNGTSEHEEHLAISRFRAIESRRALARSVNMGISALIDSNGKVLAPVKRRLQSGVELWSVPADPASQEELAIDQWHEYKQADGILEVEMPIDHRTSVYALYGDWLPLSCWVLIGVALAWGWVRGKRKEKTNHDGYCANVAG